MRIKNAFVVLQAQERLLRDSLNQQRETWKKMRFHSSCHFLMVIVTPFSLRARRPLQTAVSFVFQESLPFLITLNDPNSWSSFLSVKPTVVFLVSSSITNCLVDEQCHQWTGGKTSSPLQLREWPLFPVVVVNQEAYRPVRRPTEHGTYATELWISQFIFLVKAVLC